MTSEPGRLCVYTLLKCLTLCGGVNSIYVSAGDFVTHSRDSGYILNFAGRACAGTGYVYLRGTRSCARTGFTLFRGRGNAMQEFAWDSFARERELTFITGLWDSPKIPPKQRKISRGKNPSNALEMSLRLTALQNTRRNKNSNKADLFTPSLPR